MVRAPICIFFYSHKNVFLFLLHFYGHKLNLYMYCETYRGVQKSNYIIDLKFRFRIKKERKMKSLHSSSQIIIYSNIRMGKVNYYWQQRAEYSNICSCVWRCTAVSTSEHEKKSSCT